MTKRKAYKQEMKLLETYIPQWVKDITTPKKKESK